MVELAGLVLAGAMLAVQYSSVAMAIAAGKQSEELLQLSAITGIGTDKLQDYEVALNRANLTGQDLVQVMKHVSTSLDQAKQGTGSAADRFRQLGIDIRTVTSTDDLIRKIAQSSSKFADGAEKAAIMSDLLGKGWATFIKAFGGGTKAMDEAAAASERLGATLSGGQIAQLASMDDKIDDLTLAWKRFSQQLGASRAGVEFASNALANLLGMASNALKQLSALGGIGGAADTKAAPPPFVDQAKVLEHARAQADGLLKIHDSQLKQESADEQARAQLAIAGVDRISGIEVSAQFAIAKEQDIIRNDSSSKILANLNKELQSFDAYYARKRSMYGTDEKALADKLKFEQDSEVKRGELLNQIDLAEIKSIEARITEGKKLADLSKAWSDQSYEDAVTNAKVLDDNQNAYFQSEAGLLRGLASGQAGPLRADHGAGRSDSQRDLSTERSLEGRCGGNRHR